MCANLIETLKRGRNHVVRLSFRTFGEKAYTPAAYSGGVEGLQAGAIGLGKEAGPALNPLIGILGFPSPDPVTQGTPGTKFKPLTRLDFDSTQRVKCPHAQ